MGEDGRKLRAPKRREANNTVKRHSCPVDNEVHHVVTPRRQRFPTDEDVSAPSTPEADFDLQQIRMLERMAAGRQLGSAPAYTNFKVTAPSDVLGGEVWIAAQRTVVLAGIVFLRPRHSPIICSWSSR